MFLTLCSYDGLLIVADGIFLVLRLGADYTFQCVAKGALPLSDEPVNEYANHVCGLHVRTAA